MPQTFQLRVPSAGSSITAGNASCTVFGCEVDFQIRNTPPAWIASIGQILVSYAAKSNSETPDTFNVDTSGSTLCPLSGRAKFDVSCGWLLPAAKIDPAQLGRAAGTGAMCISLAKGLFAVWQGLTGPGTSLVHPAIIVEPGLVTTVDFFASNVYEHFPSREDVAASFQEVYRGLRPGGRFIILQPNFACSAKQYFDFFDHRLIFTHKGMIEGLEISGFELERVTPRFLPFTSKSRLPAAPWMVSLYLAVPLAWRILGGQMLLIARKPART